MRLKIQRWFIMGKQSTYNKFYFVTKLSKIDEIMTFQLIPFVTFAIILRI